MKLSKKDKEQVMTNHNFVQMQVPTKNCTKGTLFSEIT